MVPGGTGPKRRWSARLKELEADGLVRRSIVPRPAAGVVYELTELGRELEDVVLRLGRWGARSLGQRRDDEIVTADSMQLALRALFCPSAAHKLRASYRLTTGSVVVHARIERGRLEVGAGPLPNADLALETETRPARPAHRRDVGDRGSLRPHAPHDRRPHAARAVLRGLPHPTASRR
jgi:DNA-binding MarR family transcriptional regulator